MKVTLTLPPGSIDPLVRLRLIRELMDQIKWINKRDPRRQSERMQGAKYAYTMCIKRLKKL